MSDLSKLAGKVKKVNLKDNEIDMQPLTGSDFDLLQRIGTCSDEERKDVFKEILLKTIPNSTDEEFGKMSLEYMAGLQEKMMELNGIDIEEAKQKAEDLERIRKAQSGK